MQNLKQGRFAKMKVPFADITRDEGETFIEEENVETRIMRNIQEVIKKKNFVLGDYVEKFEKAFADYCGVKHCIGVANGLSALELALMGMGVGKGHQVITAANTFNATAAAIVKTGAELILVDANPDNYNLDLEKAKGLRDSAGIIIPVHLYGQTVNTPELKLSGFKIIEDACQAHGALFNQIRAGNLGEAGCFSFYPGKNLGAYGDGGAVVTNNDDLAEFLRKTRNYGQTRKYQHDERPDNSRLDTIQAAVLIEKLKVLDRWNEMRMNNADVYREELKDIDEMKTPTERIRGEHVYHLFVVRAKNRDELARYLGERGVQTGLHYPVPIHEQPCFSRELGDLRGKFPITELLSKEILTLPMFPTMRREEIKYVADCIKTFYAQ